jgi:hypothetical protein
MESEKVKAVSYRNLFRFATKKELLLNALGVFVAIIAAAALPLTTYNHN